MPDYQKMYISLFNAVTDAIYALQRGEKEGALLILIQAQRKSEEIFLSEEF